MKELWIGRNKSPLTYFKICQRKITESDGDDLRLIALEGAIIHAVDIANMLVRAEMMEIVKIETVCAEVTKFIRENCSLFLRR